MSINTDYRYYQARTAYDLAKPINRTREVNQPEHSDRTRHDLGSDQNPEPQPREDSTSIIDILA